MKKHMLMMISNLALSTSLDAFQKENNGHCFRPAFQKKLKRVKPVGFGSFKSIAYIGKPGQKAKKKQVYIDWRRLYWGNLSDLVYSAEELHDDGYQEVTHIQDQNIHSLDTQDTQAFASELRQELKSFARQYGLKIVWRKKSLDILDGTAAFLEYWDKGLSQDAPPFAELCALSAKNTAASDMGTKQKPKGKNTQNSCKGRSLEAVPFLNPFLREKEA